MAKQKPSSRTRNPTSACSISQHGRMIWRQFVKGWMTLLMVERDLPRSSSMKCEQSMTYLVELTEQAEIELKTLFVAKNAAESKPAFRWFSALVAAIDSLGITPTTLPPRSRVCGIEYGSSAVTIWEKAACISNRLPDRGVTTQSVGPLNPPRRKTSPYLFRHLLRRLVSWCQLQYKDAVDPN